MVKQIIIHPLLDYQEPDEVLECRARVILRFGNVTIKHEHIEIDTKVKTYDVNFQLPVHCSGVIYVTRYREEEPYLLNVKSFPTEDKDNLDIRITRSSWSMDTWLLVAS